MADRFYRLITFVVDICTPVLKELLVKCAKADTKIIYTTFEAYMLSRKYDIRTLRTVRKEQLDRMYPSAGQFVEGALDVSLLATLLLNLYSTNLLIADVHAIKDIREVRNTFLHKSNTENVTENEFDSKWSALKTRVLHLAYSSGGATYRDQINTEIQDLMLNNLPNLETSLKTWFFSLTFDFKEVKRHLTAVKRKLHSTSSEFHAVKMELTLSTSELLAVRKELTQTTCELLAVKNELTQTTSELLAVKKELKLVQSSTAEIKSDMESIGHKSKRSKVASKKAASKASLAAVVADRVARRIKENFHRTLRRYGHESNEIPNLQEIRALLKNKHNIVIMGADVGSNLRVAVQVIKAIGYDTEQCVEITNKDEWNSVEPGDTSLMLCKHPFGHLSFDEQKARGMLETFDSILESKIDVIVVSHCAIMDQAIRVITHGEGHGLLNKRVDVDKACAVISENTHAGPQCSHSIQSATKHDDQQFHNLLRLTRAYIQSRTCVSTPFSQDIVEHAVEKMQQCKYIVLTGEKGCGKTSVAMALVQMYKLEHCLRLLEPMDIKLVNGNRTRLVVIEDFAGKYKYDEITCQRWLQALDILLPLVQEEDIDVIITCTNNNLQTSKRELGAHKMLEHAVLVPNCTLEDTRLSEVDLRGPDVHRSVLLTLQCGIPLQREAGEEKEPFYTGLTFLSDNRLVVVDNWKKKCHVLNDQLKKIGLPYCFTSNPHSVCILSGDRVAVTTDNHQILILHVSNSNEITHVKTLNTLCQYNSISPITENMFALSTFNDPRPARIVSLTGEICEESDFTDISLPNKVYEVGSSHCTYIQGTSTLVLTDRFDNTVYMYNRNDKTTCVVRDDRIREPRGACVGPGNSIFVCSEDTNTIVHIAPTGRIIDSYSVDMAIPLAVCMSSDGKKLAVSNNKRLHVYNIVT